MGILLHVNFADQLYRNTLIRSTNNRVVNNYDDWQQYIGHGTRAGMLEGLSVKANLFCKSETSYPKLNPFSIIENWN